MSKKIIGLDIGSQNIKFVELTKKSKNQLYLNDYCSYNIDTAKYTDYMKIIENLPVIMDRFELLQKVPFVIGLSGNNIILRFFSLPQLSSAEMELILDDEVKKHIPFRIDEVEYRSAIISETKDKLKLLLAAIKKVFLDAIIEKFKTFDLKPSVIDIEDIALTNSYLYNYSNLENVKCAALINAGYNKGIMNFVSDFHLMFSNELAINTKIFLEEYNEKMSTNIKYFQDNDLKTIDNPKTVFKRSFTKVLDNIERVISFFKVNNPSMKIDKILLSGGIAEIPELTTLLSEKFNIDVEIFQGFRNIIIKPNNVFESEEKNKSYLYDVAVGLAINGLYTKIYN